MTAAFDPSPSLLPVERSPLSDAAVERLLAISPAPWPVSEAYVRRWLGSASPFTYGHAALLFAGDDAGMLVSVNPRVTGKPYAAFAFLRLRPNTPIGAALALFDEARAFARAHGASALRGPMAFSTWHPYRALAGDRDSEPAGFPGEAAEGPEHHDLYRAAGLEITDRYVSRAVRHDRAYWARHLDADALRRPADLSVRPMDREEGLVHLADLHAMIGETFAHNAHYAAIDANEFAELVLGGEHPGVVPLHLGAFSPDGRLKGVLAGYGVGDTGVLKTLAVAPTFQGGRTARALTFAFHRRLYEGGYAQALHALMKSDNRSESMSAKYAQIVRHYVLYGTTLG